MTKNRTPINRKSRFSPAAIEAFRQMQELPEGSKQWWKFHDIIFFELGKPWLFPVVERPDAKSGLPPGCPADLSWKPNAEAVANYRELDAAVMDVPKADIS